MGRVENQRRLFLELIELMRPHWRRDPGLPARLNAWLAAHRAGSRDRRLYRELAYTSWRILPWIENAPPDELVAMVATCAHVEPATEAFVATYRLPALPPSCDPAQLLPDWLAQECPAALEPRQTSALLRRAPLWIRLTRATDAERVRGELEANGWSLRPFPELPLAWRLEGTGDVTKTDAYASGCFEVQDLGSQLLLEWVRPQAGETWLDACAGAGGKSLQLAGLLGPTGRVPSHDIRAAALQELERRAARAGLNTITIEKNRPPAKAQFDGVLVDAPCTGSGTWRRAPHLKWTTRPESIARAAARQNGLLAEFAGYVRPGGRLVYATCSLCGSENEAVIEAFLSGHPEFSVEQLAPAGGLLPGEAGLVILPADVDSDAFFVSALRRQD